MLTLKRGGAVRAVCSGRRLPATGGSCCGGFRCYFLQVLAGGAAGGDAGDSRDDRGVLRWRGKGQVVPLGDVQESGQGSVVGGLAVASVGGKLCRRGGGAGR